LGRGRKKQTKEPVALGLLGKRLLLPCFGTSLGGLGLTDQCFGFQVKRLTRRTPVILEFFAKENWRTWNRICRGHDLLFVGKKSYLFSLISLQSLKVYNGNH